MRGEIGLNRTLQGDKLELSATHGVDCVDGGLCIEQQLRHGHCLLSGAEVDCCMERRPANLWEHAKQTSFRSTNEEEGQATLCKRVGGGGEKKEHIQDDGEFRMS